MNRLIWRYLDPAEEGAVGGDALDTAIDNASQPETAQENAAPETPAVAAKKFAWGDVDRRAKTEEDPELDLGYEEEKDGQKVPAKYKLSHIKEQAKWLNDNKNIIRAAMGMNKEFTANPELGKAFNTFWAKIYDGNKYNPEQVQKFNAMLEGKQEQIETTIDDKTDDIKEMEKLLEELDPESPQAKIMKSNINGLKNTRSQLAETLKANKAMQDKLEGLDKFKTGFEETQKKQKTEAEERQASELFTKEFSSLTSKDRKDGYHVEDADDAKELERLVRDQVAEAARVGSITNDEQFVKAIQSSAKAAFDTISKRNERVVNAYLQKKQPPVYKAREVPRETKPGAQGMEALDELIDKGAAEVFAGN